MGFGKKENMRRIPTLLLATAAFMTLTVSIAAASPPDHAARPDHAAKPAAGERAPAPKLDLCRFSSDEDTFHLINVNGNALEAHIAHGDTQPGDAVSEVQNYEFGEDCEIRSTQVVEGSFLGEGLSVSFVAYVSFDQVVSGTGLYSYAGNGNLMSMAISDVCLDDHESVATAWGTASSTLWGDGFLVLTLRDDGLSMSTSAVFYDVDTDALGWFASQCSDPDTSAVGGEGSLTFS